MYVLGIHTGHDASACVFREHELIAFCKEERLSRIKNDGGFFELKAIEEVLRIAGISIADINAVALTRMRLPLECYLRTSHPFRYRLRKLRGGRKTLNLATQISKLGVNNPEELLHLDEVRRQLTVKPETELYFVNHHYAHILSSFMYCDWSSDTLLVSCDGGGDNAHYSAYTYNGGDLKCVLGGEETLIEKPQNNGASIGLAYYYATKIVGFIPNRHEGKLTGLAAYGKPVVVEQILNQFYLSDDNLICSKLSGVRELVRFLESVFEGLSKEDISASIQEATEMLIGDWVKALVQKTNAKYIALSGGVFSNVRLNQLMAQLPGIEEIFVFPAMADDGLVVGACVDVLIQKDGIENLQRQRLENLYLGWSYSGNDLIKCASKRGFEVTYMENPSKETAKLLADGKVGAIFYGAMEMGPRALGARSILASPAKREVNDSINARLQRTEFMPFAPYVLKEDAERVFKIDDRNRYACRFMTITTEVNIEFAEEIPAVVHVDGTARPQIIERADNKLYHDILTEFKALTGLPCLVNTSFNAHEEPIINTPDEAIQALADDRIDFLICESGLVFRQVG